MKGRLLNLEQAEELARQAVFNYLTARPPVPDWIRRRLVLGMGPVGEYWEFELYLPGHRPEDAVVLVQARVDKSAGEVSVNSPIDDMWDSIPES